MSLKVAGPYGPGAGRRGLRKGHGSPEHGGLRSPGQGHRYRPDRGHVRRPEYATVRPIDLKGFTWYGNAEDIVQCWAKQFVQIANRRPGEIIKPASTFSLMPW